MNSRVKQIYLDLKTQLQNASFNPSVTNPKKTKFEWFQIFNNEIDESLQDVNQEYVFKFPALFIEVDLGEGTPKMAGFTFYEDCRISIHIADQLLNTPDGSMNQNLEVFDLRDSVISCLNASNRISFCSGLMLVADKQDFKHGNVYKWVVSFKTNFIDVFGSAFDEKSQISEQWLTLINPQLQLNIIKTWLSGAKYTAGENLVFYNGLVYLCFDDNNDEVWTPIHWLLLKYWIVSGWVYGDLVIYNGGIYQANADNSDPTPLTSNWYNLSFGTSVILAADGEIVTVGGLILIE